MTPERWRQIKQILDASADCDPDEVSTRVADACGDDTELRREVESFLEHQGDLEGFIEEPPVAILPKGREEPGEGRRIGPYRTVRLLGRGGMGAVFLAVREDDFDQQVALKLVQEELVSPGERRVSELIRRFHTERQILARLEHPSIARLLDGGTSDDGWPFFAMEYVEGEPLDRYCDQHRLSTLRRLELFLEVCSALEFAHRNLVIHRDLKPGNILVDASGTPKLLDFGIAKLLRPELVPLSMATRTGPGPMTPRYASPEQLLDEPITTASDIYSLGVLLYKLLTGRLPCGLDTHGLVKLTKAVCEEEPMAPSEAIGRTEEIPAGRDEKITLTPESVSRSRDGDPRMLRRRLAGDVDSIVLKALRKEPQHRYASVEQLAADIRRHLRGRPVAAREGTLAYRAAKFARRNRWPLVTSAAMLLLAAGFTFALLLQLERTSRQRDRAERVSAFLVDLFRSSEPDRAAGKELTARDIVDRGRESLQAGLEEEPEVRATVQWTLGQVYEDLGDYAQARKLLEDAVSSLRLQHGGDHEDLARAINDLAVTCVGMGDDTAAEALYREAIAMRRRLGREEDLRKPMNNLAAVLMRRGQLDEAEEIYREVLAKRRADCGDGHPNVATSLRMLANVLYTRGDLDDAEPLLREALEIRRRAFGARSTRVATVLISLGRLEQARGGALEAERLYREALDIRLQLLGEDHLEVALAKKDLASLVLAQGEQAKAHALLTQALETLYRTKPEGDWNIADAESLLGSYLTARGRYEEAEPFLLTGYRTLEKNRGPRAIYTREARRRLAELYDAWGRYAEAAEYRPEVKVAG